MHLLALAGASALIASPVAAAVEASPVLPPNPAPAATPIDTIALEHERYRRMIVPVAVMGKGPFRFIVDTGAQATVIERALADQLQLPDRRTAILVGTNSEQEVEIVTIPTLTLGSRSFPIHSAPVVDRVNIGGAHGILGLDSLQGQRVLLDFRAGEISIAEADEKQAGRYDIVVRARRHLGQLIITRAEIDGVHTSVIIDTGAQASIGNPELLRRLRAPDEAGQSLMTDINGSERTGIMRAIGSLKIGRARIANLTITFADSPTFQALDLADEPALLLGMSELRLFKRVAIDFRAREVRFDLPPGAAWPSIATTPAYAPATRIRSD